MSKLYVPIGIPGSGKSSWTEMLPGDVVVVCPDEIRVEVAKEKLPELFRNNNQELIKRLYDTQPSLKYKSLEDYTKADLMGVQIFNGIVWKEAYRRIEKFLKEGKDVVLDATNVSSDQRRTAIEVGKKHGAEIIGRNFDIDLDEAKQRVKLREERGGLGIPDHVMERMHNTYKSNRPSIEEGFDELEDADTGRKTDASIRERILVLAEKVKKLQDRRFS